MVAVVSFCLVSLTLYVYVCVYVCLVFFFTLYVRIESIESIESIGRSVGRSAVPSLDEAEAGEG